MGDQGVGNRCAQISYARPSVDATEARQVRKLATSTHAPADWIFHAKMILRSWEGQHHGQIAAEVRCHPETVRERLHAFNERGLEGLGMRPGAGRKPRLTEGERSTILALVKRSRPASPPTSGPGDLPAPS